MVNDDIEAISVAYRYFVLADTLFPGFKDHLAHNVTLKWFGRIFKGKKSVANFMLSNKKNITHTVFDRIAPISDIDRAEKPYRREKPSDRSSNVEEARRIRADNCLNEEALREIETSTEPHENVKEDAERIPFKREKENDDGTNDTSVAEKNVGAHGSSDEARVIRDDVNDTNKTDTSAIIVLDNERYDLNEGDLRDDPFEPKLAPRIVEEIRNINRVKLKEEMAPAIRAIKRERDQEGRPTVAESGTIKYLEAIGKVKVQMNLPQDSFGKYWSRFAKIRKQKCKLQIAYSVVTKCDVNTSLEIAKTDDTSRNDHVPAVTQCDVKEKEEDTKAEVAKGRKEECKLLPIEEFVRVNNTLIPDVNYFGGYLKPIDFFDDRKKFLRTFEAQLRENNPDMRSTVHFKDNRFTFNYPNKTNLSNKLRVTYKFHTIVYTKLNRQIKNKVEGEKEIEGENPPEALAQSSS